MIMRCIKPFTEPIIVDGPVTYNNRDRINNRIRLKKTILQAFSLGKEPLLCYRAELYPSFDELTRRIEELRKEGTLPILFLLQK